MKQLLVLTCLLQIAQQPTRDNYRDSTEFGSRTEDIVEFLCRDKVRIGDGSSAGRFVTVILRAREVRKAHSLLEATLTERFEKELESQPNDVA